MASNEVVRISAQLIIKDFGLEDAEFADALSLDTLESQLTKVVQYLLDKDFLRLINIMYRIDLPESTVKEILANEAPNQIAASLAKQILVRELQKAALRQKYSQG
jgi:hypothetical protein